jgi:hypothetical protein
VEHRADIHGCSDRCEEDRHEEMAQGAGRLFDSLALRGPVQHQSGRKGTMLGISKTGTATIEPGGRGHEGVPRDRPDLVALAKQVRRPLDVRYGQPSCYARMLMRQQRPGGCRQPMGGATSC